MIEKKKLPQALVAQLITNTKRQKRTILQNIQENQSRATPHPVEKKNRTELKTLAKNNKKEDCEKFASSLNWNTPENQAWNRKRHLKGKDPKKVNIREVNGAQYKDSKSMANKIGDTFAELSLPQSYDFIFSDLKQRGGQKTIYVNQTNT